MKIFHIVMMAFLLTASLLARTVSSDAACKVLLIEPLYEFDPIPEGSRLTHNFIIRNQENKPLNINDVITP